MTNIKVFSKKTISVILSLLMILTVIPSMSLTASAATNYTVGGFTGTLDDEGTLTLTGSGELTYDNAPAFYRNNSFKKVVFTKECGDVILGDSLFAVCNNITDVEINSKTKVSLGEHAFFKWSGNGPLTVTITALIIEFIKNEPINVSGDAITLTLNGKVIAAKGVFERTDNLTVTINGTAGIYQPPGKVFSGPNADMYQQMYDRYVERGPVTDNIDTVA